MCRYVVVFLLCSVIPCAWSVALDACAHTDNDCTFIAFDESNQRYHRINNDRANRPFSPFSTFKIPHTLIALKTGAATFSHHYTIDLNRYPQEAWWPDSWLGKHTLQTAFQYSVVPIYRVFAQQIGVFNMQRYLDHFRYGNQRLAPEIDNFWLNGHLAISAKEQVDFLRKAYRNEFSWVADSKQQLKTLMLVESTPEYRLYAKTGAGFLAPDKTLGWYVGFVERDSPTGVNVYYFALNVEGNSIDAIRNRRIDMAMLHLKQLGIL